MENTKLFAKMAARLADDPHYMASLMDSLRHRPDRPDYAWSEMHIALGRPRAEQHSLLLMALCRVPAADEPLRSAHIREIATTAYPDNVERGIAEVEFVLRDANILYLLQRF